jgi:hypothetical protein
MINHQHSTGSVLMMTCLLAACGGDCDCENIENRIAEIDSEISALKAPHAANHEFGGTDPINVTGLYGVLTEPQPPAVHEHNTLYYSRSEIDSILNSKTDQTAFSALDADVTLLETNSLNKSAIYSDTVEYTFTNGSVGSPFSGDIPDSVELNSDTTQIVPVVGVTLSNFSSLLKPRFFYTCEISGTSYEIRIFNADGNEVLPETVTAFDWGDVTVKISVIWTAFN